MDFDDREKKEPALEKPVEQTAASHRFRRPADIKSVALTGLFVLAIFYTMYFMRAMLLPLILAMLLSYLLSPLVRLLARIRIKAALGAAIVLLSLLGLAGYGVSLLSEPAGGWLEKAPYSLHQIKQKLLP